MKKLFAFVLVLLLALPAYAGAEEAPAAAEAVLAQGDGYTLAYDATEFSFYLDGVTEGSDLLVPTQDAPSPVYMLVSRVEDMQAEQASFAGNGYADAGEATLASGLPRRCIHWSVRAWTTPPTSSRAKARHSACSPSARSRRRNTRRSWEMW